MREGHLHRSPRPASGRFDDVRAGNHDPVGHQEPSPGHRSTGPEHLDHGGEQV
ncbi:hypothetical protein AB0953_27515 [Streptomyces sp. NPDC046866]|uniref:hypothetical protein n=1 Tax=Streptomyces sp. NPDC046866 TaxID=3154921 RepID=UPI003451B016